MLSIEGGKGQPGTPVTMYRQKANDDSQLWFEDWHGNIRSKLDYCLVLDRNRGVFTFLTFILSLQ